jgi:hypothetical protein
MSSAYDFILQFPLPLERRQPLEIVTPEAAPARDGLALIRESLPEEYLRQIGTGAELRQRRRSERHETLATTFAPLDRLLGGGLERGRVLELAGRRSAGRFSMVLAALAATTSRGEAAALVDLGDHFDPEGGEMAGIDLPRLLWVRPESVKDAVHSAELLIATGFPLVVVDLGLQLKGRRVADASWLRLARAAQAHSAAVVVSSPFHLTGTSADALVSAARMSARWKGRGKSPRLLTGLESDLTLDRHRRLRPGAKQTARLVTSHHLPASHQPAADP